MRRLLFLIPLLLLSTAAVDLEAPQPNDEAVPALDLSAANVVMNAETVTLHNEALGLDLLAFRTAGGLTSAAGFYYLCIHFGSVPLYHSCDEPAGPLDCGFYATLIPHGTTLGPAWWHAIDWELIC